MYRCVSLLLVCLWSITAYAQINLRLVTKNPLPSELTEWIEDPTVVQLVVNNTTTTSFPNATIRLTIRDENGKILAQTKPSSPALPKVSIPAGGFAAPTLLVLNGSQIINIDALDYDKRIERALLTTGSLPEGTYQVCVSIYDQAGTNITVGDAVCIDIQTLVPEPPQLVSPIDDEVLQSSFPLFRWLPVTSSNLRRSPVTYKVKVCPVFPGQSPRDALERNPVLLERNIQTTYLQTLPSDLAFEAYPTVNRYVWMVQAFDATGKPATKNEGKSELGTFFRQEGITVVPDGTLRLENVYPAHSDTIPWQTPQLVVQFSPYSDDIRSVVLTVRVRADQSTDIVSHTRQIAFPQGPLQSQFLSDQQKATLLVCNLTDEKNFAPWMQNLKMGKKYFWRVEATFTRSNGTTTTVHSSETAFTIGLKHPLRQEPQSTAAKRAGIDQVELTLQFPEPSNLNELGRDVLYNSNFNGYAAATHASAKLSFEVSRAPSFDSLVHTSTTTIPDGTPYVSGDRCEALFQPITHRLGTLQDTGMYYWRVKLNDTHDSAYFITPVASFRVVPDTFPRCFAMFIEQPANNGTWTEGRTPKFAVSVKPGIRKSAITGGRLQIWKLSSASQNISDAKQSTPLLDTTFTGSEKLYAYTTDMAGITRYDINLVNSDSSSKSFTADSGQYYLWNFKLKYNKDSIRADGNVCAVDSVLSPDGIFQVKPGADDDNKCSGDCFVTAPTNTTPGEQTLAKDSVLTIGTFSLTLTAVSGSPRSLSGEGTIDVPYLRAPILVEFNDIKVNSNNEVYEGAVFAKVDPSAGYSAANEEDFEGTVLNLADGVLKAIHNKSKSAGRLVSGFINQEPIALPLGFDKEIDGHNTVVGIIGMMFTPTKAVLNAATWVEMPSLGPDAGFGLGAKNICFHKNGIAGKKKAILYLTHDVGYQNEGSWSIFFKAPTPSDSGSYAGWDCNGMDRLVLSAEVEFPRTWLKNSGDTSAPVKAFFKGRAEKSGAGWQWMLTSSLNDCEIVDLPGFKLQVPSMVFDFSDTKNPEGIAFPENYSKEKGVAWKGFFVKNATITLPDHFRTFDGANPEATIANLLIDRTGITGKFNVNNVAQYPTINFGGWGASIDTFRVELISSSLQYSLFKGRIKTAISDTAFEYTGTIARPPTDSSGKKSTQYQFAVYPQKSMPIPLGCLHSTLTLDPSTSMTVSLSDSGFVGELTLNGSLKVDSTVEWCSKIGLSGITFSNWKVLTTKPYFITGQWNLASPQHGIAGFPVSLNNINMTTSTRDGAFAAALQFTMDVNLQSGTNGISGATTLKLWTKLVESHDGQQRFVFDGIELDSIGINADLAAVKVRGSLSLFHNEATFGNGFRGAVNATFLEKMTVDATAQFGSINDHRYWYVDAKAIMPAGIPLFSGIGIYGFGGGAWYGMSRSNTSTPQQQEGSTTSGSTPSGFIYTPDRNASFGFAASAVIGTHPSPESFNADVGLEAQFTNNGGLGSISFIGNGYMLCSITNREKAKILANPQITYYNSTQTLDGSMNVSIVNAAPLSGGGQAALHFDSRVWYIKVGEPAHPCSLTLANWLQANAYLMVGKELPAPQLPPELQQYQALVQHRDANIENGSGFAFGANQQFRTGRQPYLIFYGDITALYGFDLALLNYEGISCDGISGSMGLNGWYATGQIYAYLHALIGMHVDVWFYEGDKKILDLTLAAILQGGVPNPAWLKGRVSGNYSILGGAVKGHCEYIFSMGEQCQFITDNPLGRIDLISDISPTQGQTNVDVSVEPQVAFNFKLNEPFEIEEMPDGTTTGKIRTFRVKLNELSLRQQSTGSAVSGRTVEASDGFSAFFKPHEMLAGRTQYLFSASVYGEELVNTTWQPAKKKDGSIITQQERVTFQTASAPEKIYPQHVAYSYPLDGQQYFLQNECRSGKVQLKTGMAYLFAPRENFDVRFYARFIPEETPNLFVDVPLTYNTASASLLFNIPQLVNSKPYMLSIIRKETPNDPELARLLELMERTQQSGGIPSSSFTLSERELYSKLGSTVIQRQQHTSTTPLQPGEYELYRLHFSTSRFNTLQQKLSTYRQSSLQTESSGIFETHYITFVGTEEFDRYDLLPVRWNSCNTWYTFGPLVKVSAHQRTSLWHTQFANPFVYDEIQWMQNRGFWEGGTTYGRYSSDPQYSFANVVFSLNPPFQQTSSSIQRDEKTSGAASPAQTIRVGTPLPTLVLRYNHGIVVPEDYLTLKNRALAVLYNPLITKSASERSRLNAMINQSYQRMFRGSYPLNFYYNYGGCRDVDAEIPLIQKPFTY
jgi:hypothetical protein